MRNIRFNFTLACLLALVCGGAAARQADPAVIRGHLQFLAGDGLEGRESGSRGYDVAAQYVATRFLQYGVLPKGVQGSFLQPVPLRAARLAAGEPQLEIIGKDGVRKLAWLDDFYVGGSLMEDRSDVSAPLVFAGYGIEAARFKHNDYANLDVSGKIVVVLAGKPSRFPTEEGAHFGSSLHKRALAASRGAVGMITLQTPLAEKTVPFAKYRAYRHIPAMGWINPAGAVANQQANMQSMANLSLAASATLFANTDSRIQDIYALAEANRPLPRMKLNLSARMVKQSVRSDLVSSNVIGMIEGSDPVLKNEYVVFSAHLDHLGQVAEKSGDNIFNGAMDNATGVATLLETARLFSIAPDRPKRSVLFIALTGEEKGLLGADYFASMPTVPHGAIVANVNLDMPLLTYDFKSVIAFGAQHSSLKGTVARALGSMKLNLNDDPWPAQGLFTRSDHYMFVRQGIPSVFLATGMESFQKSEKPAALWHEFLTTRYHQPNDDLGQPINFNAAARFAQINFRIAREIANAPRRPTWNKGDFFGDTFRKN